MTAVWIDMTVHSYPWKFEINHENQEPENVYCNEPALVWKAAAVKQWILKVDSQVIRFPPVFLGR